MSVPAKLWTMLMCHWHKGEHCQAMITTNDVTKPTNAGWRIILCEDGEERAFCPKHSPLLARAEEGPQ